jgi:hypothetical protein
MNAPNSGGEYPIYKGLLKKYAGSLVAVEFAFYGPALVPPMVIMTGMIPVAARVMRATVTVETLPMNARALHNVSDHRSTCSRYQA